MGLIVGGKCRITPRGCVRINGEEICDQFTIPEGITLTIDGEFSDDGCLRLGEFSMNHWYRVAERVSETGGKIVLLGPTDTGKTYLANVIANFLGRSRVIDADVGQSSVFLPGFISLSRERGKSVLPVWETDKFKFFGYLTPSRDPRLHVEEVVSLAQCGGNLIIDTDGWFGRGLYSSMHKSMLVSRINPDWVVVLGQDFKIGGRVLSIPTSVPLRKDRASRVTKRRSRLKDYFQGASPVTVPTTAMFGEPVACREVSPSVHRCRGVRDTLEFLNLRGAYLGLLKGGDFVGAGIVESIRGDQMRVLSRVDFEAVTLGGLSIDQGFREVQLLFRPYRSPRNF